MHTPKCLWRRSIPCKEILPAGAVATREQPRELVAFAKRNGSILIFDATYAAFIQDDSLPRSVVEVEDARETALEVNSISICTGGGGAVE